MLKILSSFFQLKRRDSPHPKPHGVGGSTSSSGGSQEVQEEDGTEAKKTEEPKEEAGGQEQDMDLELRRNSTEEVAQELFANIEQFTMQAKQAAEQGSLELGKAFRYVQKVLLEIFYVS